MRRFILTGAPGAGKTTILRALAAQGFAVVEEAATDVIARLRAEGVTEPWRYPWFIDRILDVQETRQSAAPSAPGDLQFFDRAPLDTLALCRWLGFPVSPGLHERFRTAQEAGGFERDVFFIEDPGYCEPTEARRISYEDAVRFGRLHADVYHEWGYRCIGIPPVAVPERVRAIRDHAALTPSCRPRCLFSPPGHGEGSGSDQGRE